MRTVINFRCILLSTRSWVELSTCTVGHSGRSKKGVIKLILYPEIIALTL